LSKLSLPKDKIKILLLEGVHRNALTTLERHGYTNVELLPGALNAEELKAKIGDVHMLGIRSRTYLTAEVLKSAEKLMAVGCFCIGTNQVDLKSARNLGIPVFNAPYSNTRSVAEMALAQAILLARRIPERNWDTHEGGWQKSAEGCHEVRGKVLGIIGYGHIGSQLSILAESIGMQVRFFDIEEKLPLGNAQPCTSMDELLRISDVVSLHVPENPGTQDMIGAAQFARMKKGVIFLNAARGTVVDIDALVDALKSGQVRGAAVDVFPAEPADAKEAFQSPLRGFRNVILTPHIGGSTVEAQANIGIEVAEKFAKYSDNGSTMGAVNMVEVALPVQAAQSRFMHIHHNVPGVISAINAVFSKRGINISGQYLRTDGEVGYVVADVDAEVEEGQGIRRELSAIDGTIRVRFLV